MHFIFIWSKIKCREEKNDALIEISTILFVFDPFFGMYFCMHCSWLRQTGNNETILSLWMRVYACVHPILKLISAAKAVDRSAEITFFCVVARVFVCVESNQIYGCIKMVDVPEMHSDIERTKRQQETICFYYSISLFRLCSLVFSVWPWKSKYRYRWYRLRQKQITLQ